MAGENARQCCHAQNSLQSEMDMGMHVLLPSRSPQRECISSTMGAEFGAEPSNETESQFIRVPQKYWDHLFDMAFLATISTPFD
jgi:hypothetical protein